MKEKILIVDDIAENRILLLELLSDFPGIEVDEAEDSFAAVELAKRKKYDIILMDVRMPGLDGFEAAKTIKKLKQNRNATIIFITAHDEDGKEIQKGIEAGGIDYITKPIEFDELLRLLNLYIRFIRREKKIHSQLSNTNKTLQKEIRTRKKIEVQLVKVQEDFKNIVGKSGAGILITDDNGTIKFINPAAENIFMREASEMIGEEFGFISNSERKSYITIIRKNGTTGTGEITTTKTVWNNKPAWLILINDVTEHIRLQENLKVAKIKAQESDKLKSAFLSNMSHEIRTPMNGIMGFVDLLIRDEHIDRKKRKDFLKIIKKCGEHLLGLINDIVDLSKIEAGQMTIKLADCNVAKIFRELKDMFSTNKKILKKNIEFLIDIPPETGKLYIKTDEHKLKQIFINLIGNAIKFTDTGYIKCGGNIKTDEIEFFVEDTGRGIPQDKVSRVFDRFVQIEDTTNIQYKGTGLGLTISRSFVRMLGGDISLQSEAGKGTIFYFTLPNIKSTYRHKQENKHLLINGEPKKDVAGYSCKKILIVEDNDVNYTLLCSILNEAGIRIERAVNGKEAVHYCRKDEIDLVLMDIKMPVMDGLKATEKIRKFNKTIPIIAQTAYELEGEGEKCIKAGCDDYISKPIKRKEIMQKLNRYL